MGEGGESASTARTRPNAASMQASGRALRRRRRGVLSVAKAAPVRDMMRSKEQVSFAPVAQMDRVLASEAKGHRFDSCRARQIQKGHPLGGPFLFDVCDGSRRTCGSSRVRRSRARQRCRASGDGPEGVSGPRPRILLSGAPNTKGSPAGWPFLIGPVGLKMRFSPDDGWEASVLRTGEGPLNP